MGGRWSLNLIFRKKAKYPIPIFSDKRKLSLIPISAKSKLSDTCECKSSIKPLRFACVYFVERSGLRSGGRLPDTVKWVFSPAGGCLPDTVKWVFFPRRWVFTRHCNVGIFPRQVGVLTHKNSRTFKFLTWRLVIMTWGVSDRVAFCWLVDWAMPP